MLKKMAVCGFALLGACDSQVPLSKSPYQDFYDQNLFFDLEQEGERQSCQVQGEIPAWLSGTLLRNGPAKFQVGNQRVSWFDGLAMLHAFEFNSKKVLYSNRFLRSAQYAIMMDGKSLNFSGFAQDPCPKVFKNQTSHFIPDSMKELKNAVVSIQEYADRMVALTEVPLPVVFNPNNLDTEGAFHFEDALPEGQWESAHPQHDLSTKETFNYFIEFGEKSQYVIWKMADNNAQRELVANIPADLPSYMHSFALTEKYVVLVEFPFVVNPLDLMLMKKPFIFNYKWKPERGTQFFVVERDSGKIARFKTAAFFAFHHVNAYEKQGKIFVDIITYPNADIIGTLTGKISDPKMIQASEKSKLERFTVDLAQEKISREVVCEDAVEMPRVSAAKTAQPYRYCYVIDGRLPTSVKDKPLLYKIDVDSKDSKTWGQEGCFPGEPIFVPRPNSSAEDDGVVLSLVLDYAKRRSFLLILDAQSFQEKARVEAPHAIPLGLHGLWDASQK